MFKAGIFIWETQYDYKPAARITNDDAQGAMSVALFKVNDGMNLMQTVDEAIALARQYRAQGIDFLPWGVARGFNLATARGEGMFAGQYAAATGSDYILDLEGDPSLYWQGITGTPRAFCEGYALTALGHPLRICPDARATAAGANGERINLREWVVEPVVSLWHPQIYYTAFEQTLEHGVALGVDPLLNAGVPQSHIYPSMPLYAEGTGDPPISPDDLERDTKYIAAQGFPGLAWWRRGLMSPEQVARSLAMADPFTHDPQPPVTTRPRLEYVSTQEHWDDATGLYHVESTYREAGA